MLPRSPMKHNCRQISGEITWMRIKEHLSALILLKLFTRHPGYWLRSVTQWVAPTGPWFVPPLQQRIKCPGIKDLLGNTWQIKQNPWNCISVRGSFSAATTWQRRRLVAGWCIGKFSNACLAPPRQDNNSHPGPTSPLAQPRQVNFSFLHHWVGK